jgi:simple sugar transport system permease protein
VRTATPLALAALGEMVTERAGVINIGLEGAIVAGAFGALSVPGSRPAGRGGARLRRGRARGLAAGRCSPLFAVALRADQIITGTA